MSAPTTGLMDLARQWTAELPEQSARTLAAALRGGPAAVRKFRREVNGSQSKAAATEASNIEATEGHYLAGLLDGLLDARAHQPTITPVWTGPTTSDASHRLTLAVVADLIAEARSELILVSYATYPSEGIRAALKAAAESGVAITLLLERAADNPGFKGSITPFPGLDSTQLHWPVAARPNGASMHAKLLVVDRHIALVGSANLTGMALESNLECGVLVRGGTLPGKLAEHVLHAPGLVAL